MPSFFEISAAAFAIGMATNANVPNSAPQAPQKSEVVVQQAEEASPAPLPAPKPAETDVADAKAQPSGSATPR